MHNHAGGRQGCKEAPAWPESSGGKLFSHGTAGDQASWQRTPPFALARRRISKQEHAARRP